MASDAKPLIEGEGRQGSAAVIARHYPAPSTHVMLGRRQVKPRFTFHAKDDKCADVLTNYRLYSTIVAQLFGDTS
ncbi:hypothetical protein RRG08_007045 [Elysia crispata]|uniref:Uncharacterized protein n=1 Tax=Elysia crispata TaxID=231223 RepID=A0AAE0ZIN3_9GAST|nr:hypothetical protein RRG08_007045 [Elysia crispata]